MTRYLPLYIGLRYLRAKRRSRFISFISWASIVGIALSIAVLITVLSVINGFDEQIRHRFFAIAPQVTITSSQDIMQFWPKLTQNYLQRISQIKAAAPFINGQGMVLNGDMLRGVNIVGILPGPEATVSELRRQVIAGDIRSLTPGSFHIMLGKTLAQQLNLQVDDSVSIFVPQQDDELLPHFNYQRFVVTALFSSSKGFGFDQLLVYVNLTDAQKLLTATPYWNGLHLKLADLYQAGLVTQQLQALLPPNYTVSNWMQQFGAFFQNLATQKTMLFVILLFILAIAVFNLISTLIMVVDEKRADIAILRTLGATPMIIMNTFIVQGALIGLAGTLSGLVAGIVLALNITAIVDTIQRLFHLQLISETVYFINFLPSKILFTDILQVCSVAFGLSVLATIYPALLAFRTQPAQELRYE